VKRKDWEELGRLGYSNEIKEQALAMYLEDLGFRGDSSFIMNQQYHYLNG
jgi:hypothetical protein